MKTIMRLMLGSVVLAAALCFDVPASQGYGDAPWCAVVNVGTGNLIWDCQYYTIEECVPHVLAGNRGFCNQNPGWDVPTSVAPRKHRKRHRV